ncbi:MAG: ATP-binding protein [Bacteroidota bacterium]
MENHQEIVLLIVIGCISMILMAAIVVLFVALYKRNMLQKENEIKIIEQQQQISLFKASVEAEEQQKEKIARNLHDEINPLLAVLKFNLSKHRIEARKNTFEPDSLIADSTLLDKAIEGIRTTCLDLIPTFLLQYGLIRSLEQYLDHVQQLGSVQVEFRNNIPDNALEHFEKQNQLNTYRICLEILNNTFKHANCRELNMSMDLKDQQLIIHISHNGTGVSNEEMDTFTENSKGLGLKSLKARALILNSTIDYKKDTPHSSVTLSIPYIYG